MREEFDGRRKYMYHRIQEMPLVDCLEPWGAFYMFVDISQTLDKDYKGQKVGDSMRLTEILLEEFSIAVVPCGDFGFPNHIRLSYAISREAIEKGLDRLEAFVKSL